MTRSASAFDLVRQAWLDGKVGSADEAKGGRPWLGNRSAFLLTRTSNASFSACCTFDLTLARFDTAGKWARPCVSPARLGDS